MGWLVFSAGLHGTGILLIIDHGDSEMIPYGYNPRFSEQVCGAIRTCGRVAGPPDSGCGPDSGLYFETRHAERLFDPTMWTSVQ
jgi:septal ring factor EnvC (AmiA/AmiB activator)